MRKLPIITLRNLVIERQKCIGLQFDPSAPIQTLVQSLGDVQWSESYGMYYLPKSDDALTKVFDTFRGIAWVNCRYFFRNRPLREEGQAEDLSPIRRRANETSPLPACPEEYIRLLEIKRYSLSTARAYTFLFSEFMAFFRDKDLAEINENDIRTYLMHVVRQGKSASRQNQVINAIKFYYEQVLEMPQRFYVIERPIKDKKLPLVLSEEEVSKLISATKNLKHKAILVTIYSCGLRLSELLELKILRSSQHHPGKTVQCAKCSIDFEACPEGCGDPEDGIGTHAPALLRDTSAGVRYGLTAHSSAPGS
jgi:integrase/recombinase XerD